MILILHEKDLKENTNIIINHDLLRAIQYSDLVLVREMKHYRVLKSRMHLTDVKTITDNEFKEIQEEYFK